MSFELFPEPTDFNWRMDVPKVKRGAVLATPHGHHDRPPDQDFDALRAPAAAVASAMAIASLLSFMIGPPKSATKKRITLYIPDRY